MLPVTVQFFIAMVANAINERMGRRVEYLQEDVRVLKEALAAATGTTRIAFTREQRRRLVLKGKALTASCGPCGPSASSTSASSGNVTCAALLKRPTTTRRSDGSDAERGLGGLLLRFYHRQAG
jgi:hypothetical protein